jgi:ribosomal protein S18 acetylase RimI-like enzyme
MQNPPMAKASGGRFLRRATEKDAPGIARVHVKTWQEAYADTLPSVYLSSLDLAARERYWRTELGGMPPERRPWVVESDGEVLGFVASGPSRDEGAALSTGEVYALYVLPEHWSMGIGRHLLAHAERDLLEHGYSHATLWVLAENERARRFYEEAGWARDAGTEKVDRIGGHDVREVRYRVALDWARVHPRP